MTAALIIGGVVCTALSMAGGFITDLKIGYWLGTTPPQAGGMEIPRHVRCWRQPWPGVMIVLNNIVRISWARAPSWLRRPTPWRP